MKNTHLFEIGHIMDDQSIIVEQFPASDSSKVWEYLSQSFQGIQTVDNYEACYLNSK